MSQDKYGSGLGHIPSDEEMERCLAYQAYKLAEKQIQDGTAKAQVITHFLKLGSPRESIERKALQAKIQLLESQIKRNEVEMQTQQLLIEALDALRNYRGETDEMLY